MCDCGDDFDLVRPMKEKELPPIEANFTILEDMGTVNYLECPRCGCEFHIDAMDESEENMIWSWKQMAFVALCPLCGTQQE